MTVIACPHGCGGIVNTAKSPWCESCRRGIHETDVILPEYVHFDPYDPAGEIPPAHHKLSWCWQWWGPAHHRMRCRLPKGHDGPHDCHEERDEDCISVSTDGALV